MSINFGTHCLTVPNNLAIKPLSLPMSCIILVAMFIASGVPLLASFKAASVDLITLEPLPANINPLPITSPTKGTADIKDNIA